MSLLPATPGDIERSCLECDSASPPVTDPDQYLPRWGDRLICKSMMRSAEHPKNTGTKMRRGLRTEHDGSGDGKLIRDRRPEVICTIPRHGKEDVVLLLDHQISVRRLSRRRSAHACSLHRGEQFKLARRRVVMPGDFLRTRMRGLAHEPAHHERPFLRPAAAARPTSTPMGGLWCATVVQGVRWP